MKFLNMKSYLPTISTCIGLLISVSGLNQSIAAIGSRSNEASTVNNVISYDYWLKDWEEYNTITLNNYKYVADELIKKMDSFIASTALRHSTLDNLSNRLNKFTQFNKVLEPQIKTLCNYDRNCLEKFDQIAERIPKVTAIFRLLRETQDAEVSVIAEYQKFKKSFNEAEAKIPNGGFLVVSESGSHMQYIVRQLFSAVKDMISSSQNLSSSSKDIYFDNGFTLTGNYSSQSQVDVSFDLVKSRLHISRTFCETPIIASLDLSTGKLLSSDQSGLNYSSYGVKRLPSSYFLNLIGDYEIQGNCRKKLFGSPSLELEANNKLNVSYQIFTYKTYTIDEFGMGGGSGWKTHSKMKRVSAQIF
ncbi:MAG: hypothetical protein ACXVCP_09350 [Bdellovibrio sp.]